MAEKIVIRGLADMPQVSISLGDTSFNKTGTWRYMRPFYSTKLAPCRDACPLGTNIPLVLRLVSEGKLSAAQSIIRQTNPLPGVLGRVCYHSCEAACSRSAYDQAVSIRELERYVADACENSGHENAPAVCRLQKVAIVGAGPAGLSCACYLSREGFRVRIFEADDRPGGMLRQGIPEYRLPRHVLDRDIANIEGLGVEFEMNCRIGRDVELKALQEEFDAVFVATGAHGSRNLSIPGEHLPGVWSGLEFLSRVNRGEQLDVGREVLVIGGGNTAMDSARVALRLGAKVTVVYRRSRSEMPAIPEEVGQAEEEGAYLVFQAAPQSIRQRGDGLDVRFARMRLGPADRSGRPRPIAIEGSEFTVSARSVIKAIGEFPDFDFGYRPGQANFQPEQASVAHSGSLFAGGDVWTGPSTVTDAVAAGRKAAMQIAGFLDRAPASLAADPRPATTVTFAQLNTAYFETAPRRHPSKEPVSGRTQDFREVVHSLTLRNALEEARRCFGCGLCNQCDTCWLYCPDAAISRCNGEYLINLDYCKGCGICGQECPRGVISLAQEVQ